MLLAGCAALPAPPAQTVPPAQTAAPVSTRTITCVTRDMSDGLHFRFLEHRLQVADPSVIAFLDSRPELDGRLMLGDLLFLERLAETRHRALLLEPPSVARERTPEAVNAVAAVKLRMLREALGCSGFLDEIAQNIDEDARDTENEHGGILLLTDSEECPAHLLTIASTTAGDDHGYDLPMELFTASSMAVWHDHAANDRRQPAEDLDNSAAAGPSGTASGSIVTVWGDMWIAYLRGIDGVVFTPTGGGTFSVIFFSSDGQKVDLGRYRRP
jgi:hypothetical protein